MLRVRYTEVDIRERIPGLFPGHIASFIFDNGDGAAPTHHTMTIGRLLVQGNYHSLLEAVIEIPTSRGGLSTPTLKAAGVVITPNSLVPHTHHGKQRMTPIYTSWTECQGWRGAAEKCDADVRLLFPENAAHHVVRTADHERDLEDPVSRRWYTGAD